jgi:hypothetical protein
MNLWSKLKTLSSRLKINPSIDDINEAKQFLNQRKKQREIHTTPTFEEHNISKLNLAIKSGDESTIKNTFLEAAINNAKSREKSDGKPVYLRWLTSEKCKKSEFCCDLHGRVISQQDAFRSILARPKNCECGLALVPSDANTEKRQKLFDKERRKLLANIAN